MFRAWLVLAFGLVACGSSEPKVCGVAECEPVCAAQTPPPAGVVLSDFEKSLVEPLLAEIKAGVRPYDDAAIGLCAGDKRECPEFLGPTPAELAQGRYSISARLKVPDIGPKGTWKVVFESSCDTISVAPDGTDKRATAKYDREYDVIFVGDDKPYILAPLRVIDVPAKNGLRQECTYTIRVPHADGERRYEGAWVVPAKAASGDGSRERAPQ